MSVEDRTPGPGAPRSRQRLCSLALAAVTAAGLLGTTGAPAVADPHDRQRQVQHQLSSTAAELDMDSAALVAATSRAAAVQRQLGPAQAALLQARAAVTVARARDVAAQAELQRAEDAVALAVRRVQETTRELSAQRDRMGRVAAEAYRGSGVSVLSFALGHADDPAALSEGLAAVGSVMRSQSSTVDDLADLRAKLATRRAELQGLQAVAAQRRAEAAAQLVSTRGLEQSASQRASAVAALVQQRQSAVADAQAAKAADAQRYGALLAERERIAALIRERIRAQRAAAARAAHLAAVRQARWRAHLAAVERSRQLRLEHAKEAARRAGLARAERAAAQRRAARLQRAADAARRHRAADAARRHRAAAARSGPRSTYHWTPPAPVVRAPQPRRTSGLAWPIPGAPVTSPYGMRVHPITHVYKLHDGTDFGAGCGTPIRAAASGRVVYASMLTGYGNQVLVDDGTVRGTPLSTSYSHMERFAVGGGQRVSQGQVLGYVGQTGYATGCHLHFMVYVNGGTVNPMNWL